jgi:hypothetical protein
MRWASGTTIRVCAETGGVFCAETGGVFCAETGGVFVMGRPAGLLALLPVSTAWMNGSLMLAVQRLRCARLWLSERRGYSACRVAGIFGANRTQIAEFLLQPEITASSAQGQVSQGQLSQGANSARGPGHCPATDQMHMSVPDRLPTVRPSVDHHAVPVRQSFLAGHGNGRGIQLSQQERIGLKYRGGISVMGFRDDQHMYRGLWSEIPEGQGTSIVSDDRGGNFPGNDPAE